jgi:uncharacterized PurR-regulated membrane protein YhhQ (DUF165 family)
MGFLLAAAAFAVTVRNFLAKPSKNGLYAGWASMLAFAALAAYCFWRGEALRQEPALSPESRAALAQVVRRAQALMVGSLIGLLASAFAVTRMRKGLGKP